MPSTLISRKPFLTHAPGARAFDAELVLGSAHRPILRSLASGHRGRIRWSGKFGDFRCDLATKRLECSIDEVGLRLEIECVWFCDQCQCEVGSEGLRAVGRYYLLRGICPNGYSVLHPFVGCHCLRVGFGYLSFRCKQVFVH